MEVALAFGYKQLVDAEDAFRTLKSTLGLQPVCHRLKDPRSCACADQLAASPIGPNDRNPYGGVVAESAENNLLTEHHLDCAFHLLFYFLYLIITMFLFSILMMGECCLLSLSLFAYFR